MGATNGRTDAQFIADVRRILRDQPVYFPEAQPTDGIAGSLAPGGKPFRFQRAPITLGSVGLTAPGGNYGGVVNSYLPAYNMPAWPGTVPPGVQNGGPGGTLPAGDYQVFWTLGTGVSGDTPASLPSPVSNKITQVANRILQIINLPNPIPVGGINIYILWQSTGTPPPNAWGFALFIPANAVAPYNVTAPGDGVSPVFINSDTGEVWFAAPPAASATLAATYQATRYSDAQVSAALYEGLQLLWPDIWNPNTDTTSILVSPTQYEYPLPAIFQDQRTTLLSVEFAPPSGIVRYFKTSLWRLVMDISNPILVFSRIPPVASTVRLTYSQPLGNGALGGTPTMAMHLPTYYALARLLVDQDTMRSRSDDLPALTGEAAQQPGVAINTANYWLQQFSTQLGRLSLGEVSRMSIQHRAVERLGLSDLWTDLE